MAESDLNHLVTGVWKLLSFEALLADAPETVIAQPLGPSPVGRLHLSPLKYMSVMLTSPEGMKPLQSKTWGQATDEEVLRIARPMISYCGPYTVFRSGEELQLSTQVELAMDSNWIGGEQVRKVEIFEEGETPRLTLTPNFVHELPVSSNPPLPHFGNCRMLRYKCRRCRNMVD
jgi:hypothetical protein